MTAIRPADAERFVAKPDPAIRVILLHGSDDGLIAERARAFARSVTGSDDDPFALVRLESGEIADDPARLADEANAVPLFGGRRAILIRHQGNRAIDGPVKAVLDAPPVDSWVVIAAGELRKDSPLRRVCEASGGAAAIACYADSSRDLDRIIDEELAEAGLSMTADARALLQGLIGSDRMASRSEIRKLCLYSADDGAIGAADVRAIVGDASAFATDEAVDALALGDPNTFDRSFRRLVASGTPAFVIAGAALRHFAFLHRARASYDEGTAAKTIISRARPPVFYQRQPGVERQIALWPRRQIERALEAIDKAIADSRIRGAISDEVIGQALSLLAALGASLKRNRRSS